AVWKAGGAYVPLDPEYPAERLAFMAVDSGMTLLVTDRGLGDDLAGTATVMRLDDAAVRAAVDACPATVPGVVVLPGQSAYVIYTSGSTGRPKGVQVSHYSAVNLAVGLQPVYQVDENDALLQFVAFSFDVAISEVIVALTSGATLVISTP